MSPEVGKLTVFMLTVPAPSGGRMPKGQEGGKLNIKIPEDGQAMFPVDLPDNFSYLIKLYT